MHKPPFLFVFNTNLMAIIFLPILLPLLLPVFSPPLPAAYAQEGLTFEVNKRVFSTGDTLVVFGRSIPSDSLIAELYNPKGALVQRTQIDVGVEGSFARILLQWSVPTDRLPFGAYTLIIKSSTSEERRATEAISFQSGSGVSGTGVERELTVQLNAPSVIGRNEVTKVVVQIAINGVLVKGDKQTLKDSHIHYPDGSIKPIETFTVLEDGVYITDFGSSILGHHTIHVQAFQQGLFASNAIGIFVEEGPILSLGNEIANVNSNIETLNANIQGLRDETSERIDTINKEVSDIGSQVSNIGSAAGQVTSLLLPIIGMIAIIVALQATILARRSGRTPSV
jgi:hypothetical protein